jgi:hypothetical protein
MNNRFLYNTAAAYLENSFRIARTLSIFLAGGLLVYRLLLIFSYNGELAGIDNNFVFDVSRSIEGTGPYTNPAAAPYAITLYSPLYFSICAIIGKLFHVNPDNAIEVYQLCRTLALVADFITCILLYRILRNRFRVRNELCWLAIACFACILCKLGYTFSRSDSFLLGSYAGVMYVLTGNSRKSMPQVILLSLFSTACILSKQNGIIIPVVVLMWLLLSHEKKTALYYSIIFLVICALAIFAYRASYPYLFANTVTALRNRIDFSWFYSDIFKRSMDSLWMLPLYLAAIFSVRQWIKPSQPGDNWLAAAFVIQMVFGLAISFKWGSSVSYFNECFFLAFIILFRKVAAVERDGNITGVKKTMAVLMPLLLLFFVHTVTEGYLFFCNTGRRRKWLTNSKRK